MTLSATTLLNDLQPLLKELRQDLMERAQIESLRPGLERAYEQTKAEGRTADAFAIWVDDRCGQIAASWVLSIIFVRTLEDRNLLERRRIAGPAAKDSEEQFFQMAPFLTPRDYLLTVFRELMHLPGIRHVFDARHNPVWLLGPSGEMARTLLSFFRDEDEQGNLLREFQGDDTRFLGDLYQDLYEDVRKRYALLQTPDFVESFILDETLTPAIDTFGLEDCRLIDPTCGSGHFLLGAYDRLFNAWVEAEPTKRHDVLAQQALTQVAGVDLNPYAVAIARFRLTLSFLQKAEIQKLKDAPALELNVCVGDSLLHGAKGFGGKGPKAGSAGQLDFASSLEQEKRAEWGKTIFTLEDSDEAERILTRGYHAVVGNPPYIIVKDKARNQAYRDIYKSCHRKYQLVAPFLERFFQLCVKGGYQGSIVGNGFMKREFGKKLIQDIFPKLNLTGVIDTSGAYIPGHGTPTTILFGRNQPPSEAPILTILGSRGEPSTPDNPAEGKVWKSIEDNFHKVGFENDFITVAETERERFTKHPWSLSGGGASELKQLIDNSCTQKLDDHVESIGFGAITGEDDAFFADSYTFKRKSLPAEFLREVGIGEAIRDWSASFDTSSIFPYPDLELIPWENLPQQVLGYLWPNKRFLLDRKVFNGGRYIDAGRTPHEYHQIPLNRFRTPLSIAFAFVATHNHFVLDRGGKVFNRTAPIIKLPEDATEDDHLALLGYLNSSVACFYLKQVCHNKGSEESLNPIKDGETLVFDLLRGTTGGGGGYEFSGTAMGKLPVPEWVLTEKGLIHLSKTLDRLAQNLPTFNLDQIDNEATAESLQSYFDSSRTQYNASILQMVALQEDIDWLIYEKLGIAGTLDVQPLNTDRTLAPGRRACDLWLAQRHSVENITQMIGPDGHEMLLDSGQADQITQARLQAIAGSKQLKTLESFPYKRRWEPMDIAALWIQNLQTWLLARLEEVFSNDTTQPMCLSVREIAGQLAADTKFNAVAEVYTGEQDPNLEKLIGALMAKEEVPYLAAYRYKESGLKKRDEWEKTWALQRQEDAGEEVDVPVPPKYKNGDFINADYYRLRGKLDVPKERFIGYPDTEDDEAPSPIYGWAGWDHLQLATALAALYQTRLSHDGWSADKLTPMLAGLRELIPWLKQWHNEPNEDFGGERLGEYFDNFVDAQLREQQLSPYALKAFRPPKKQSSPKKKTKKSTKKKQATSTEAQA